MSDSCTRDCRHGRSRPSRAAPRASTLNPPRAGKPSHWMGFACTALAALLVVLTVALAIALLADHFIFTNGGFTWTWPST